MQKSNVKSEESISQSDKLTTKVLFSSLMVALSSFSFGISLTLFECINSIRDIPPEPTLIKNSLLISDIQYSLLVSVYCIGALISNLCINSIPGSLKQKITYNNLLYIAGNILILLMMDFYTLLIARFLKGLAIGVTCSVVPMYLNLIAPANIRGMIGCLHGFGIVFGVLIGQILSYIYQTVDTWKIAYYGNLLFLVLHTFCLFAIQGAKACGSDTSEMSVTELLKYGKARKSLIIAVIVHLTQQTSCINGVINYSTTILKSTSNPQLSTIYVGTMSVLSTMVSMVVIDKFGRKMMIISSCLISILGLVCLAFEKNPVVSLFIFIIGFNLGLGPVVWMLTGEIFPNQCAQAGGTIAVSVNWVANFIISSVFAIVLDALGTKSFLIYAVAVLLAAIYLMIAFKETKGKVNDFQ